MLDKLCNPSSGPLRFPRTRLSEVGHTTLIIVSPSPMAGVWWNAQGECDISTGIYYHRRRKVSRTLSCIIAARHENRCRVARAHRGISAWWPAFRCWYEVGLLRRTKMLFANVRRRDSSPNWRTSNEVPSIW